MLRSRCHFEPFLREISSALNPRFLTWQKTLAKLQTKLGKLAERALQDSNAAKTVGIDSSLRH